ncbi:MAG: ATP-dependent DNA helicase RecG [Gammaproteobacteria bacterium]
MKNDQDDSFEYRSVTTLKGVGPAVAQKLARLDIHNIQDVLFHLPLRYEDRTRVVPIGSLRPGQQAVIEGVIEHAEIKFGGRRVRGRSGRSLLCFLADGTGGIVLRFFHFNANQQANLANGVRLRCFGEVRPGANSLEITHPEYRRLFENSATDVEENLTPVYPKTEGVHQTLLRSIAGQVLSQLDADTVKDWLPESIRAAQAFPDLQSAIHTVHQPPPDIQLQEIEQYRHPAQRRLIFEELLAHQLSLVQLRKRMQSKKAVQLKLASDSYQAFVQGLGFDLTGAQQKVIAEILRDLATDIPMLRLLQGDVGSGKTVVAACAALAAAANGRQVAVMAPTEILAQQHFENFSRWFDAYEYECLLLTGKHKGKARQQRLDSIANGGAQIVIGTHALFQDEVVFKNLALVIVDEQHRFGVHQRLALQQKGKLEQTVPHQLIMTATPIPRSLAMTAYADLDYSVIDELPKGRKPISTVVVSDARRQEVIDRVASACKRGEQAYWVCTLIEESDVLQCQAAEEAAAQLTLELSDLNIGLVHGRMKQEQKADIVERFKQGNIDLLVATTVIEVGVDVPGASLMVIENAERLGLAQLHQLRGRVGRGSRKSACVLMYHAPLSQQGRQRLSILRETASGFVVAQKDLEMRGPGEVLGTRQTGLLQLRIADIVREQAMLPDVKRAAETIMQHHPEAVRPLIRRWLGTADRYGEV